MTKGVRMEERIKKFKKALRQKGLFGFIITNPFNIFYLSGFKGVSPTEREAILIATSKKFTLITARLYQQEALILKSKSLDVKIANERNEINEFINDTFSSIRGLTPKVGVEEHDLKISEYKEYKKILKGKRLIPVKHIVEDIRIVKSDDEIKNIEKAQKISLTSFKELVKSIKVGQSEVEIAERLSKIFKKMGGHGLAFESIIASGKNSAKPHHITGARRLVKNDTLLLDFGAKYKNYCADLTRTIFIGKARDEHKNIYNQVFAAQNKAIDNLENGIKASKTHSYVHNHFKENNFEQNFLHSLGHGIGLEVHERPSLSKKSKDILNESMVFSVEPGLYFPNWGGVRIEDLVVIKNGKAKILGKKSEFIEIL